MRSNENGEVNRGLHTKGMSSPGTLPPSRQAALFLTLPTPGTQGSTTEKKPEIAGIEERDKDLEASRDRAYVSRKDTGGGGTHL